MKARDKFWIFGVPAHQDDIFLGRTAKDRNYSWSRITPGGHMKMEKMAALLSTGN